MARYQVTLAYDGTSFLGFQRQGNVRTVQAEVEFTLRKLGWQGRTILAAGRTDTGVHAAGQVIAFDMDWVHGTAALERAMNAWLPNDVAVRAISEADGDFHPRYAANCRTYRYKIFCQSWRNPLLESYAWRVWPEIDYSLLGEAANLMVGRYDFSAFGTPPRADGSTIRTVFRAGWQRLEEVMAFDITANAFLYHMVRRIVNAHILVGQGKLEMQKLADALHKASGLPSGLAPAKGLSLMSVEYSGVKARETGCDFDKDN
jgi:tRNA pseudouridine38-40 synthase